MTERPDPTAFDYVPLNRRPYGGHERLLALVGTSGRVLDVGCSSGYLARRLVARGNTVVGIDSDTAAAAVAEAVCDLVIVGDIETMDLPFAPGSFDAVLCGDLLEHLADPLRFLERVRPLLQPQGMLVLSTPNVANWAIRLALLAGRWRYTDRGILDRTHRHLFTKKTLEEAVEQAGYRIVEFDVTAPVPIITSASVERLAHAVAAVRPSLFAYQFIVSATPR